MPKIPPQKYLVVVRKLKKRGFIYKRSSGSHEIWWSDATRETCVVPHHAEIKSGTMKSILQQANISFEEYKKI